MRWPGPAATAAAVSSAILRAIARLFRILQGRQAGSWGERVAARHLRRHGLEILARNVHAAQGELDLVAWDGETLVFVEVKAIHAAYHRSGLERIGREKRRCLSNAARDFLRRHGRGVSSWRCDAVTVRYRCSRLGWRIVEAIAWHRDGVPLDWD